MRQPGGFRKKRGSILLLALLFMFILFLMAVALFQTIPTELHSAYRSRNDLMGHYVADAGIKNAVAWLEDCVTKFQASQNVDDLPDGQLPTWNGDHDGAGAEDPSTVINNEWGWRATITPDPLMNTENANFMPRVYHITTVAQLQGRDYRTVRVSVRQASFAGYAMFVDQWPTDGTAWDLGSGGVNGPVHTNDFLVLIPPSVAYWTQTARAYFWGPRSEVTFSTNFGATGGDGLAYIDGNANPTTPPTVMTTQNYDLLPYDEGGATARYYRMLEKGRESLKIKKEVDLPSASAGLSDRAWDTRSSDKGGSVADKPTDQGVFLKADGSDKLVGGVYINGKTEVMDLRLDQVGNQDLRVTQTVPYDETQTVWQWVQESYSPPQYQDVPTYTWKQVTQTVTVPVYKTETYTVMEPVYGWKKVGTKQVPVYKTVTVYEKGVGGIIQPVTKTVIDHYDTVDDIQWVKIGEQLVTKTKQVQIGTTTQEQTVWVKVQTGTKKVEILKWVQKPVGTKTVTKWKNVTTRVIEVTEAAVTVKDKNGLDVTANVGDTMLIKPDNTVDTFTGQPNGTIFNNGDVENLRGVVKGSAYDKDTDGNWQYRNKTIAVDIAQAQSVDIGDDLLQFDPAGLKTVPASEKKKFETSKYDDSDQWRVAGTTLDSSQKDKSGNWYPETSPNSQHALGLIAQDVYVKGTESQAGNVIDIYGVLLAGRSIVDADGKKIDSTGGYGTHSTQLGNSKKGQFRIIGGVIQAKPHAWYKGGGYVGDLWYDDEASKQEIFPTYARFTTLRYTETPRN